MPASYLTDSLGRNGWGFNDLVEELASKRAEEGPLKRFGENVCGHLHCGKVSSFQSVFFDSFVNSKVTNVDVLRALRSGTSVLDHLDGGEVILEDYLRVDGHVHLLEEVCDSTDGGNRIGEADQLALGGRERCDLLLS